MVLVYAFYDVVKPCGTKINYRIIMYNAALYVYCLSYVF
jgi:hypothetical protein